MKDYWITVIADNYMSARLLFIEQFSSQFMEAPDKWAFQYGEDQFDSTFFRKGNYLTINQNENLEKNTNP